MSVGLTLYCAQEEIAVSLGCCPNFAMGLLAKLDNMANGAAPAPPALPGATSTPSPPPPKANAGEPATSAETSAGKAGPANPKAETADEHRPAKKARAPKPQATVSLQILYEPCKPCLFSGYIGPLCYVTPL